MYLVQPAEVRGVFYCYVWSGEQTLKCYSIHSCLWRTTFAISLRSHVLLTLHFRINNSFKVTLIWNYSLAIYSINSILSTADLLQLDSVVWRFLASLLSCFRLAWCQQSPIICYMCPRLLTLAIKTTIVLKMTLINVSLVKQNWYAVGYATESTSTLWLHMHACTCVFSSLMSTMTVQCML